MGLYDAFTVLSRKGGSEAGQQGGGVPGGGGRGRGEGAEEDGEGVEMEMEMEVEVEATWPIDRSVGL